MDCVLILESHIQHSLASSTVLPWICAVLKHVPDISVFLLIALMEGRHFKDLIKAADWVARLWSIKAFCSRNCRPRELMTGMIAACSSLQLVVTSSVRKTLQMNCQRRNKRLLIRVKDNSGWASVGVCLFSVCLSCFFRLKKKKYFSCVRVRVHASLCVCAVS